MRKPTHLLLAALSVMLPACTTANFVPKPHGGGSGGVVGPGDTAPPQTCEPATATVCLSTASGATQDCPSLCHDYSNGTVDTQGECSSDVDNCVSGSVCLSPNGKGDTSRVCYQTCTSMADCKAVACSRRFLDPATTIMACDPPYQECPNCCDPLANTNSGCPASRQNCYLVPSSGVNSSTLCDFATGTTARDGACNSSLDCYPKLTCVPSSPLASTGYCKRACSVSDPNGCNGNKCIAPQGQQYGYCP